MKQLIFDIETLGQKSTSVCLCASFLVYDIANDKNVPLLELESRVRTFKLDVDEQVALGRSKTQSTLDWWRGQLETSPHLRKFLARSPNDLKMKEFYNELQIWLKEQGYKRSDFIWQRGTIDIMILDDIWDMIGYEQKNYPMYWWKVREIRTAIDLLGDTEMDGYIKGFKDNMSKIIPGFTKHNPAHDILLEVHQLREIGLFA